MLYDPKWGEWSLVRFIAFAKTKPPGERYDFTQIRRCAIAQFRIAYGINPIAIVSSEIPQPFREILNPGPATAMCDLPDGYTWGDLLKRAEAMAKVSEFA